MNIQIVTADYVNPVHASALSFLMNAYAIDPMGGGKPLAIEVLDNLAAELSKRSYAFSVICFVNNDPVGLITCFEMFSTFACKPIVNIHDIIVLEEYRGHRLSQKMLEKVEQIAVAKGCCKLTLEVLEGNQSAQSVYKRFGFSDYQLDPQMGGALFWQKNLS